MPLNGFLLIRSAVRLVLIVAVAMLAVLGIAYLSGCAPHGTSRLMIAPQLARIARGMRLERDSVCRTLYAHPASPRRDSVAVTYQCPQYRADSMWRPKQ